MGRLVQGPIQMKYVKLFKELGKEDIPIAKGPLEAPGLAKWIYICDPDNNIIEFVQWL